MRRRFVCFQGNSSKFWEIEQQKDSAVAITWGKIGGAAHKKIHEFPTSRIAAEYEKLVAQKIAKGYVEVNGATDVGQRVHNLLDAIKADFPRRLAAVAELIPIDAHMARFEIGIAEKAVELPTFHQSCRRRTSPMLAARFAYGGSWRAGLDIWLCPREMKDWMHTDDVRSQHIALRENWEASAPMKFDDDRLTLFGVTENVPDSLEYLVWAKDDAEPEIWTYSGWASYRFQDLATYLEWCLCRE